MLRNLLRWWIWNEGSWTLAPDGVERLRPEFEAAQLALVSALDGKAKAAHDAREAEWIAKGLPAELAATLARAAHAYETFAVIAAARNSKLTPAQATPMYYRIGRELHVNTLDQILQTQVPANMWERRFLTSLERGASWVRQEAIAKLAADPGYIEKHKERIGAIGDSLRMVRQSGGQGLVPLYLILEDYRATW